MHLDFIVIRKLCNPQAISITVSSKPNLVHLRRSLTIRHRLTPPMACSTRIRNEDISLFSRFCSCVNSFPLGFLVGIFTVICAGLCPKILYLTTKLFPQEIEWAAHQQSFCREYCLQKCAKATKSVVEGCTIAYFLPL